MKIIWYPKGSNGYAGVGASGIRYRVSSRSGIIVVSNGVDVQRAASLSDAIKMCEEEEKGYGSSLNENTNC